MQNSRWFSFGIFWKLSNFRSSPGSAEAKAQIIYLSFSDTRVQRAEVHTLQISSGRRIFRICTLSERMVFFKAWKTAETGWVRIPENLLLQTRNQTLYSTAQHSKGRSSSVPQCAAGDVWNLLGPGISEDGQTLASRWDFRGISEFPRQKSWQHWRQLLGWLEILGETPVHIGPAKPIFLDFELPSYELISWTQKRCQLIWCRISWGSWIKADLRLEILGPELLSPSSVRLLLWSWEPPNDPNSQRLCPRRVFAQLHVRGSGETLKPKHQSLEIWKDQSLFFGKHPHWIWWNWHRCCLKTPLGCILLTHQATCWDQTQDFSLDTCHVVKCNFVSFEM